ncbi:MAG: primosomal protein N' [Candidatus Moranbacteria bacterium]|nr:primosomal protein N' [Candidatus Moranbacteria bacterium]MDD3965103.1 primosomal protein N' [Candidatus Moranbacteria bacterium]
MKKSELYRIEVAPLLILPLGKSPLFSYLSKDPIAPGSLVAISFGKRSLEGVVFGVAPLPGKAPIWMKYISKIVREKSLTPSQLALALFMSEEYFTSLGKVLKHFLPKYILPKKKETSLSTSTEIVRLGKSDNEILETFLAMKSGSISYLQTSSLSDFDAFLVKLTKKLATKKEQTLVIVPEIILLPALETLFARYFPQEKIALVQSKLSDGLYSKNWERIRSGEASIVLSTRQGLFAPFQNLGAVIVLEEQDESYKQWTMSPRYDARNVAKALVRESHVKLIFTSGIPSIESLSSLKKEEYSLLHPLTLSPPLLASLQIVNLRLERFRKNYSPLSQELITALQETMNHKEQALLYIHRQGMDAFSVCENCKNIFRCPKSGHVLSSTKEGTFKCLGCHYTTDSFPGCPQCGHLTFRHVGFGTERIEREIKKLFPGARVFRADGATMRTEKNIQKFHTDVSSGNVDILIGTQMVIKGQTLPKLSLIGMIDTDSLLSFPDFRADEKLFQTLTRFVVQDTKSQEMCSKRRVIVQTFHPESTFFQRIGSLDSKAFGERILAEREDLFYPPFSRLISIISQGKTEEESLKNAKKIGQNIETLLTERHIRHRLSIPNEAKKNIGKKIFTCRTLIRIPKEKSLPEDLQVFLEKIDMTFIIDIDPLSFL